MRRARPLERCVCCRPAAPRARKPIRSPSSRARPSPIRRGTCSIRAVDLNPRGSGKGGTGALFGLGVARSAADDAAQMVPLPTAASWSSMSRCAVPFSSSKANLASDDPELWQPAAYDVIFCRNVLMYFAPEQMRAAIARIAAVAGAGRLSVPRPCRDAARHFRRVSSLPHPRTFYYRRKDAASAGASPQVIDVDGASAAAAPAVMPALALTTAWVDTIRQASERVAALVSAANGENPPTQSRSTALGARAGARSAAPRALRRGARPRAQRTAGSRERSRRAAGQSGAARPERPTCRPPKRPASGFS